MAPSASPRTGRNTPCPCGSGRKYKHCCGAAAREATVSTPKPPSGLQAVPAGFAAGPPRGPSIEDLLRSANRLAESGRLAEAIPLLEQMVRATPDNADALRNLGVAYLHTSQLAPAVACLQQAVALKPTDTDAFFNLGLAFECLGQSREAIAAFRKAVAIKPRMATAHQRLGDLLRAEGQEADSVRAYRRAAAAAPATSLGRLSKAWILIAEHKRDDAEACLRRAIALDPGDGVLHWTLACFLAESGRLEEAAVSFRQAIELDPEKKMVGIYREFLWCTKLSAADRPLLDGMIERVERGDLVGPRRMDLLFAIAKGHDDLGDYGAAMRCFDEANAIRRKSAVVDLDAYVRRGDDIIAAFPPALLARAAELGDPDPRPVFVLGMPRSGTTLVEQIISSHPDVAGGGELTFWPARGAQLDWTDGAGSAIASLASLVRDYRAELDRISPTALKVTDKMPFNFEWIGLIRLALPNARFVHCSRHPVDTALSIYTTPFSHRSDFAADRASIVAVYRQYLKLMDHWRTALPPGVLFEARYEAIVADPEPWSRALVDFCGVEWDDACLRPEANPHVVRTASLWQSRQPIYSDSVERWRRYEPWLGELRDLLPLQG